MVRVQIFISHSSKDAESVDTVARQVEAMGIYVYRADHDVRPGRNLPLKVQRAIETSDAVLVLLTTNSMSAPFVQQEVGFALGREKPVIPLVERGLAEADRAMLEGVEVILFDTRAPHEALIQLTAALRGVADQRAEHRRQQTDAILALAVVAMLLILSFSSE